LRLVIHSEIPEDPGLHQQWNALVQRLDRPQVFFTWEWAFAVQLAYHAALRPLLFLAYDERESLCAIAALAANPQGTEVTFLCATTADYCDFLSSQQDKSEFISAVLAELKNRGIADITLTNLPADSNTVTALEQASARLGYRFFARTAYVCAQVSLAKLDRVAGESRPVLPRKKMVRRFLNAMGRNAPVRLDHARSWDAVEVALPEFIQSHVARFLVTGLISNMARPERQLFLRELAKLLCESGWLDLTRMMSGQKVYAWNYGFRFQDTLFWYQPTFDSSLEKYSPGFCLLAKLIEESADNPALKVVDLGLGAEEYKDRFSNESRETLYLTLRTSSARHYREIGRYYAAETMRAVPKTEQAARGLRQRWHRLRQRKQGSAATFVWAAKRAREFLSSESEVVFYEWTGSARPDSISNEIQALDLNALAGATMRYVNDDSTLTYLLRAAARLREGRAEGFGLTDSAGAFVHFAWVVAFDGFFLSELNAKVDAPSPESVMLFDCWTPAAVRGHGYYGRTIARVAQTMRERGKEPWIFSAASNLASIRGLEKVGFERRYSLKRQRALWWQRIKGKTPTAIESHAAEVSAHV
jgi:CelD/BcsL family acetyltransferase involved in cellulose biosynthesis